MTFDEILTQQNLNYVTELSDFKRYQLHNSDKALKFVQEIKRDDLRVSIVPDPDPDGMFAALCIKQMLDRIGHRKYEVYELSSKNHGITDSMVSELLTKGVDRVIIVDSSSNNIKQLQALTSVGVEVLVIDHHESGFSFDSYPEGCIVINPRIELKSNPKIPYGELSACFACALVCDYILHSMNAKTDYSFYIYGYITLYSDTCDLSNRYNLSIINKFCRANIKIPSLVSYFMDLKYDCLCRNFISFKLVPRLNALFRLNKFDILHKVFFKWDRLTTRERQLIRQSIEDHYALAKSIVKTLVEHCTKITYKNMVLIRLDNLENKIGQPPEIIRNFTGLACQTFTEESGKPAFSLLSVSNDTLQGSCRDSLNRNILSLCEVLFKAGGHPSAFGIEVDKHNLERCLNRLDIAIGRLASEGKQFFLIDEDSPNLSSQINKLAEYNEISGTGNLPMIYITKNITSDMRIFEKENYTSIMWNTERIVSFENNINIGDRVYLKPTLGKYGAQLFVNNKM